MNELVYKKMIELLQHSFQCNSEADNLSYNLAYLNYNNIEEIYHAEVAHIFPMVADEISNFILLTGGRPTRLGLVPNIEYFQSLEDIFVASQDMVDDFLKNIEDTIELAIENKNYATEIFLKDLLMRLLPLRKQGIKWLDYINKNTDSQVDADFKQISLFVPVKVRG